MKTLADHAAQCLRWERSYRGPLSAGDVRQLTRDTLAEVAVGLGIPTADIPAAVDAAIAAATEAAPS